MLRIAVGEGVNRANVSEKPNNLFALIDESSDDTGVVDCLDEG